MPKCACTAALSARKNGLVARSKQFRSARSVCQPHAKRQSLDARLQSGIVRVDGNGESGIGGGIFMSAVNQCAIAALSFQGLHTFAPLCLQTHARSPVQTGCHRQKRSVIRQMVSNMAQRVATDI